MDCGYCCPSIVDCWGVVVVLVVVVVVAGAARGGISGCPEKSQGTGDARVSVVTLPGIERVKLFQ